VDVGILSLDAHPATASNSAPAPDIAIARPCRIVTKSAFGLLAHIDHQSWIKPT
jgi:hypothetical protein